MKQEIDIELAHLSNDWEAVRIGYPNCGEWAISRSGAPYFYSTGLQRLSIIVRRKIKIDWPEWIKPGTWITRDSSGAVRWVVCCG